MLTWIWMTNVKRLKYKTKPNKQTKKLNLVYPLYMQNYFHTTWTLYNAKSEAFMFLVFSLEDYSHICNFVRMVSLMFRLKLPFQFNPFPVKIKNSSFFYLVHISVKCSPLIKYSCTKQTTLSQWNIETWKQNNIAIIQYCTDLPDHIKATVTPFFPPFPHICQDVFHASVPQYSLSTTHAIVLQTWREKTVAGDGKQ